MPRVDTREPGNRKEAMRRGGWELAKLDYGDYDGYDATAKPWIVEHKTVEKMLADMQSGTLIRQCRSVIEHCIFPILMVQGHWAQNKGYLLDSRWTWEQAWNQLETVQDMGMRLQLTTSEEHTIKRLFELELYYSKESHPSASRGLSGNPAIATLCLIDGVGEDKARALLERFNNLGYLSSMAQVKQEALLEVPGVGETLAQRLHDFFWGTGGER